MKLLVTGGAGFIGSNYVRWVLEHYARYQLAYRPLKDGG